MSLMLWKFKYLMQSGTALKVDESITRDWLGRFLGTSKIAEGKKIKKAHKPTHKKKISQLPTLQVKALISEI